MITRGTVHGRTILLQEDPGISDGQEVEVTLRVSPRPTEEWGEGLRRCAGALEKSWSAEDDRVLAELHRERKSDTRREIAV